jgi:signal peptidase II
VIERDWQSYARFRGILLTISIAMAVLISDQSTKALVLLRLGPSGDQEVIPVIPGVLHFLYVENTGIAFGILQGNSILLAILAVVVVLVLAIYFRRLMVESSWFALALGLLFGGAVGNIVDRVQHGFVIDFIDFSYWPTFNLADGAITTGVIILGIYVFKRDQRRGSSSKKDVEVPDQTWVT